MMKEIDIINRLKKVIKPESISLWLTIPNEYFDGKVPAACFNEDEKWSNFFHAMESGEPS
jgi:hypothetical protein